MQRNIKNCDILNILLFKLMTKYKKLKFIIRISKISDLEMKFQEKIYESDNKNMKYFVELVNNL